MRSATILAVLLAILIPATSLGDLTPEETLGKMLFFDPDLSDPPGLACAACHAPEWGFTGPDSDINAGPAVYPGVVQTRSGNRKPPSAAYGGESPVLFYDEGDETWVGGMFWDGRATGWTLGDPLAEQAQGPFLNPLEQNNPNARLVCLKVSRSDYADLFEEVWGPGSLDYINDVAGTYERIARSISAYEKSEEVNPFSSKFDVARDEFTAQEEWGLELFDDPEKGNCAACHPSTSDPDLDPDHALFTDFTYDNLGVPKNPENPFYSQPPKWNPAGEDWIDPGLGGFLEAAGYEDQVADNLGKQKVPTLRNVGLMPDPGMTKAYSHNGFFKSLKEIVHFYNTRDVESWPDPEVAENVNTEELGDLGLTDDEEDAIVAFLMTLSDGYDSGLRLLPPDDAGLQAAPVAIRAYPSLIRAYPNPIRSDGVIEWSSLSPVATLELYDAAGRRILARELHRTGEGASQTSWRDLVGDSGLSPGVYFMRLGGGHEPATRIVLTR